MVLTAKLTPNFRQRRGGELLDDVHGHLARKSNRTSVAANLQVLLAKIEMLAHAFLDEINGDPLFLRGDDVAQHLLRGSERNRGAGERRVGH